MVSCLESSVEIVMDLLEQLQTRAAEMAKWMHHSCHGERLQDVGFFRKKKSRLGGDLAAAFQYVKGKIKKLEKHILSRPALIGQGAALLN